MIYIGYPCISKTILTNYADNIIELDFSYFMTETSSSILVINANAESTNYNKYENYCKLAIDLNNQGFNVFINFSKQIIQYLSDYYKEQGRSIYNFCLVYPAEDLYADWSKKALEKYLSYGTNKNKKELNNILENYKRDTSDLELLCFTERYNYIKITGMDYSLETRIKDISSNPEGGCDKKTSKQASLLYSHFVFPSP